MTKLEPIWQNIPDHFKRNMVTMLEYKDRCCLRKCSKSDRLSVDVSKSHLNSLAIHTAENYSIFQFSDSTDENSIFTVKYFKNLGETQLRVEFSKSPRIYLPGKNQKTIFKITKFLEDVREDEDDLDFALRDFEVAINKLNCKKVIINDLIIADYHPIADPLRTMELRERILRISKKIDKKSIIQCETLHLKWHQEDDQVLQILSIFDSRKLEKIEFSDRNAVWKFGKISESPIWKNAKICNLEVISEELPVEQLFHFIEVSAHFRNLDENELWKVIKNMISKNQHGSSFHFSYRQSEPDLQRILATFDVPPIDQPINAQTRLRSVLGSRFLHTQRFPMPSPNLVLIVMISEKEVMGSVCHVDRVDVEAKVERGLLR